MLLTAVNVMCADDSSVVAISSDVRAARDVHGAVILVQHYLLRAQLSCR